ncbi:MAG: hypothetical protein ACXADB_03800 [Candidatus Hermodarchaeia archaeon]|jgi:hypothetical protein
MGTDYYRCSICDLQVNDCIEYHHHCNHCGSIICWNCTFDLGITKRADGDEQPEPISDSPFKMEKIIVDEEYDEDESYYELLNCPLCEDRDESKQKEEVLQYLLKKNKLTLKKAIEEMNSAKGS